MASSKPEPNPSSVGTNGAEDRFTLPGPFGRQLEELQADAELYARTIAALAPKVAIVGTARSKADPGANGHQDWLWAVRLGEELRLREMAVGTGAGPGAMEAPLAGYKSVELRIQDGSLEPEPAPKVVEGVSPEAVPNDLRTQGANIMLPHEQSANPHVDRLATFERFLFRMEFLFRNTSELIATPGGFGTLAEVFTFLALKSEGEHSDRIVFGAPDDFFERMNAALAPLFSGGERAELHNTERDPTRLVEGLAQGPRGVGLEACPKTMSARQRDDLEAGLLSLSKLPPAVAFVGGAGPASERSAPLVSGIAEALSREGIAARVGGSPVIDEAVRRGALRGDPEAKVQAFALEQSAVTDSPGLAYHRVDDFLVLRELLTTHSRGLVVTPEGAKAMATAFVTACDFQTRELPKVPIVVVDPSGEFERALETIGELMLSDTRRYINPEDLGIFTVVKSVDEAVRALTA